MDPRQTPCFPNSQRSTDSDIITVIAFARRCRRDVQQIVPVKASPIKGRAVSLNCVSGNLVAISTLVRSVARTQRSTEAGPFLVEKLEVSVYEV